jgi:hypothetical protein
MQTVRESRWAFRSDTCGHLMEPWKCEPSLTHCAKSANDELRRELTVSLSLDVRPLADTDLTSTGRR